MGNRRTKPCDCPTCQALAAALATRGLPPTAGLTRLLEHAWRQGAQVAALVPDLDARKRLVDAHLPRRPSTPNHGAA